MRFQEAFDGWTQGRLTQAEAALLPGQCERSFRRHIARYQASGLDGLLAKRLSQTSKRCANGAPMKTTKYIGSRGRACQPTSAMTASVTELINSGETATA